MLEKIKARADIIGSKSYPGIRGKALFYQTDRGVIVAVEVKGLPTGITCQEPIYAFHIHEGDKCTGNDQDLFANVKTHYNPRCCNHPYHAGDMPPLFSNAGYALLIYVTNRFTVKEIIGRTVVIHDMPDDFTTQPSGNAGEKIACGVITRI